MKNGNLVKVSVGTIVAVVIFVAGYMISSQKEVNADFRDQMRARVTYEQYYREQGQVVDRLDKICERLRLMEQNQAKIIQALPKK
jgi:hypothetical protein